jgi:hypothetical protein
MTRDPIPQGGKTITIDGVTVRLVPIPGLERAPVRVRFEIMDGPRVVRAMLSCPSAADCHDAIRAARHPPPALVDLKGKQFNPWAPSARLKSRKAKQKAEEPDTTEMEPD